MRYWTPFGYTTTVYAGERNEGSTGGSGDGESSGEGTLVGQPAWGENPLLTTAYLVNK